jgi:hypothetical protein
MVGSQSDVNQGTTVGGDERACRGQSVRSSEEAGNDRGAKGRRNVVVAGGVNPTHKGRCSAARLCASARGRLAGERTDGDQWATLKGVSGARACAAGALLLSALRRVPEPAHREPRTGKPDAGNPPVRFGRAGRSLTLLSDLHRRKDPSRENGSRATIPCRGPNDRRAANDALMKPNLRLCLLATSLASAFSNHAQEILFHHQGATDPVSEGFFSRVSPPPYSFVGPTNDIGRDAWWVFNNGAGVTYYRYSLSSAQQSLLASADSMLTFTTRIGGYPNWSHTSGMTYYRGSEGFWIGLDMQADGDPIVRTGPHQDAWVYEGGGSGYHDYQFIHHVATGKASLWADGVERVTGIEAQPGWGY